MKNISSRKVLCGKLSSADLAITKRYIIGLRAMREKSKRVVRSEDEWQRRRDLLGTTQTRHEESAATIRAITMRERRVAVLLEVSVTGQTTRGTKFWSALKSAELVSEASAAFPFLNMMLAKMLITKLPMVRRVELIRSFVSVFAYPSGSGDEKPIETVSKGGDVVRWSAKFCTRCDRRHAGCVTCFLPVEQQQVFLAVSSLHTHKHDTLVAKEATARAGDFFFWFEKTRNRDAPFVAAAAASDRIELYFRFCAYISPVVLAAPLALAVIN